MPRVKMTAEERLKKRNNDQQIRRMKQKQNMGDVEYRKKRAKEAKKYRQNQKK